MRALMIAMTMTVLAAAPLFAQERGAPDSKGYITGLGGFATSVGNTTGDMLLEGGVRIAPHVKVFGNVGRFSNLQADLQPTRVLLSSAVGAFPPGTVSVACALKCQPGVACCRTCSAGLGSRA